MMTHSSTLIVDFPSKPRRASVSFAHMADLKLYDCPTSERRSKSYSAKDFSSFRIKTVQDGKRVGDMFDQAKPQDLPQGDDQYELVGVECMTSPGCQKSSLMHRRVHSHLIISMQGSFTVEDLCKLSQLSSMPSQRIARRSASLPTATVQTSQNICKRS